MEFILTSDEMKFTERYTIENIGVPSVALMETASRNAYDEIIKIISPNDLVVIFCGVGNNGADGLCITRFLMQNGFNVMPIIIGDRDRATVEWKLQYNILVNLNAEFGDVKQLNKSWINPAVVVDALFGIGLSRDIEGIHREMIDLINQLKTSKKAKVISLDIPSGLGSSDGRVYGVAVKADITITNQCLKTGLLLGEGPDYTGRIIVKDTGISLINKENYCVSFGEEDLSLLTRRNNTGNKGTAGKVLVIAGSNKMPGAALLCARSAFMSGAGMVKVITDSSNKELYMHELPECMLGYYDEYSEEDYINDFEWSDTCVIGPGLSISPLTEKLVELSMRNYKGRLVLDADGLNILSKMPELFRLRKDAGYETIITPHPGEFSRIFDTKISDKCHQNISFLKDSASQLGIVLVAKDARTIVTDGKRTYINKMSTPALSTAGSGDVLAGITAAICGYHKDLFEATSFAVFVHSLAGIDAAYEYGEKSVTASMVANAIYRVIG